MILELSFATIYILAMVLSFRALAQLKRFLAQTPAITDPISLDRFKSLVRVQMYMALAAIGIMLPAIAIGIGLVVRYGLAGMAAVTLANGVLFGFAVYLKSITVKTRGLQAAPEALAREYQNVCETWVRKALPDF